MRTHELRRRLHVLDELGLWHVLMGGMSADPVQANSMFLPPWRDRLADGRLGPTYGSEVPTRWHQAWADWRASIYGGGLWDEAEEHRRPRPDPAPIGFESMEAFLLRVGHRLPPTEARVASMRFRDHMPSTSIAKRLELSRSDVDGLLRVFIRRWQDATVGPRAEP